MKKLALLLFAGAIFTSCNDGDLVFNNLNFNGNVQKCSQKSIYYKLNGNEMLLLNMTSLIDEKNPLPLDKEFEMNTSSSNILYRLYNGKAISGSICDLIAPANPQVIEEYSANSGGTIKYKRVRQIVQSATDSRVLINYVYAFTFENLVLSNEEKELKFESYNFGEYADSSNSLDFNVGNPFNTCSNSDLFFYKGDQYFKIIGTDIQFESAVGTQTINLNSNQYIKFYLLNEKVAPVEICEMNFTSPTVAIKEEWTANQGVLEIVTTANSTVENPEIITGYTQTYILKNASFTSESYSFTIDNQTLSTISLRP